MTTSEHLDGSALAGGRRSGTAHPLRRRAAVAMAVVGLLGGGALALAAPASAAGDPYIASNSGGANLRAQPDTSAYSIEYLGNGTPLVMICWVDAQTVSPPNANYTSPRWFRVEPTYDVNVGYVHSSLVTNQSSVGRC